MSRSGKLVMFSAAVVGVAACVFLTAVLVGQGLVRASLYSAVVGALAGVVAAGAAVVALVPRSPKPPMPPELEVLEGFVDRPQEIAAVVSALVSGRARTVGITTGLYGAGGFGKTTLAHMVCTNRRVRRRFGGRVYLVTVGRDVRGAAAVAAKVNDVIKLVTGEDVTFTDPELAGRRLGSLLDAGPRRLLVLDDVWEPEQLAPFAEGGLRCARLVTSRAPDLLAGRCVTVRVDQMSPSQARALLTSGLPRLDPVVVDGLLAVTGRWPLLLHLVNKILADYAHVAEDVSAQGAILIERLRLGGPATVDKVLGETVRGLDVGRPRERSLAVQATMQASSGLLDRDHAERFAELGVFAGNEVIPFNLVSRLWRATASLDDLEAAQVCKRLIHLALVSAAGSSAGIILHDVVRDFLRADLGQQLAGLNGMLLDAASEDLPGAGPLDSTAELPLHVAWWELGDEDRYLWEHLIEHVLDAGRLDEAEVIACDLRWVEARLMRFGPAASAADLSRVGSPRALRLRITLARVAHLLAPTEPTEAVMDVLRSRVADDPDWRFQVKTLRQSGHRSRLVNRWPLPDAPDPAFRRLLTGHTEHVSALAVAPDGAWLATGSNDTTVRLWDVATWQARLTLEGHRLGSVFALAVAPDGNWLATAGQAYGGMVWDVGTGQVRAKLKVHSGFAMVEGLAWAPDCSWLATGHSDGIVRIWDVDTWRCQVTLRGHAHNATALAVAPDGTWLATGNSGVDGVLRIWDVATWQERTALDEPGGGIGAIAVGPDGTWLATGGWSRTVRIRDVATWQERATLDAPGGSIRSLAVAPDGTWLATADSGGTARIWDVATWQAVGSLKDIENLDAMVVAADSSWLATAGGDYRARVWDVATVRSRGNLEKHTGKVTALVAAPDGSWLATADYKGPLQIWDVTTRQVRATLKDRTDSVAMAVAPDSSWLATADRYGGTMQIWDLATGQVRATLEGADPRNSIAVAPDGSWLATRGSDGTARIWDVATGQVRVSLKETTHGSVSKVAVAPDGSWLATGSSSSKGVALRIWDMATGQVRTTLETGRGRPGFVSAIAVAPDGAWLAAANDEGPLRIWDVATGQVRATLKEHVISVAAMAAAPDGAWLAVVQYGGTLQVWEVSTGQPQALMRVDNRIYACAWLGVHGVAVGGEAGLYLFDFLPNGPAATAAKYK